VPDHARPLAERGRREATLAGEHIRAGVSLFDLVLCSTSERTRQTLAETGLAAGATVRYLDELYGAEYDEILDLIAEVPGSATTLLVVGHFPGVADLAEGLAGPGSDGDALAGIARKFPTSAFAVLAVTGAWSALPANSRLKAFTVPRHHPRAQAAPTTAPTAEES